MQHVIVEPQSLGADCCAGCSTPVCIVLNSTTCGDGDARRSMVVDQDAPTSA
jgi:hypothetical protein